MRYSKFDGMVHCIKMHKLQTTKNIFYKIMEKMTILLSWKNLTVKIYASFLNHVISSTNML